MTALQEPKASQEAIDLKRLERERKARLAAESIAEIGLRNLYEKQKEVMLLQVIAAAANKASAIEEAIQAALDQVCLHTGWPVGHAYIRLQGQDRMDPTSIWHLEHPERFEAFRRLAEAMPMPRGIGLPGRILASGRPAWIMDVTRDDNFPRALQAVEINVRAAFGFPVLVGSEVVAVLEFFFETARAPDDKLMELMAYAGTQLGRVIERQRASEALRETNRRLTETLEALKRTQQQVIQQERLRALGEMASGVAHDFNNALSAVVGFTSMLLGRPSELENKERLRHHLELIQIAGLDAANVVRRLREFYRSRDETDAAAPLDINRLLAEAIALTEPKWKGQAQASGVTITVETSFQEVPPVAGNETELREVFTNLIFNAADAMPGGGTLTFSTACDESRSAVSVRVKDTGVGMTEDVRRRCVEPFFSTKGERGTGLGLSVALGVIQRHEGSMQIASQPGAGTEFTIQLPAHREGGHPPSEAVGRRPSRPLRVLVVDDDPTPRQVVVDCLEGDGHTVETAGNGREGAERFQSGWFDVVITEIAMPQMNGVQLAAVIKRLAPQKPVIMLTGFGDIMNASADRPEGVDLVLSKPITLTSLREALSIVR